MSGPSMCVLTLDLVLSMKVVENRCDRWRSGADLGVVTVNGVKHLRTEARLPPPTTSATYPGSRLAATIPGNRPDGVLCS